MTTMTLPLPPLATQVAFAEATSTVVAEEVGFYLPPVLPMWDGSTSYLLHAVWHNTETATYRHKVTGECVTFGWGECTTA